MGVSREGFQWTPRSGLQNGLPSLGVIEPPRKLHASGGAFDVIVVGAGYTGLTAARDASTNGLCLGYNLVLGYLG